MKFWQLLSTADRDEPHLLDRLADRDEWAHFREWVAEGDLLVKQQQRDKLDAPVPDDAVRHVFQGSTVVYYLGSDSVGDQRLRARALGDERPLLARDVLEFCDGAILEEVREYGSARPADFPRASS